MIDAVFTWVDGADPQHAMERRRFLEAETGKIARHGASETRYNDAGELYYSLQLVRKFAPWIAKIHLVTDRQCPTWLTSELRARMGVVVVDHADIIPLSLRPTFNAVSIESFLDNIPDLTEKFLYFNDDIFLIAPTTESDYFAPGPRFRGAWISDPMRPIEGLSREFKGLMARLWVRSKFRDGQVCEPGALAKWGQSSNKTFWLAHAPYPLTRALFAQVREKLDLPGNARFRFRSPEQAHLISLLANLGMLAGAATTGPDDWDYIHPRKHVDAVARHRLKRCESGEFLSLCVQSLDEAKPGIRDQIIHWLDRLVASGMDK